MMATHVHARTDVAAVSRLTRKYQATIPRLVREKLKLRQGDVVAFVVRDDEVVLSRAEPLDVEYLKAVQGTLGEWLSDADEEAYRDL